MTNPFPGFLLELSSMKHRSVTHFHSLSTITRDSRRKAGKGFVMPLRTSLAWSRPLFIDLLTLHGDIFCEKNLLKALLDIACKPSNSRLQILTRVAWSSKPRKLEDGKPRKLEDGKPQIGRFGRLRPNCPICTVCRLFQTLQAKITLLINIRIERVPATLINTCLASDYISNSCVLPEHV